MNTILMNLECMKRFGAEFNISISNDLEESVETMTKWFRENHEESSLAKCERCGGESAIDLSQCPYCGSSFGGEVKIDKEEVEKKEKKIKKAKKIKKEKKIKKAKPIEKKLVPAKKKVKKAKDKTIVEDFVDDVVDVTESEQADIYDGGDFNKPEESKSDSSSENTESIISEEEQAIVVEVKQRTENIRTLRSDMAVHAHDIGKELMEVHDRNLWKSLGYKNFTHYLLDEFEWTRTMAYKYMGLVKNFSKEEAQVLGVSKAEVISSAPETMKSELIGMAKEGTSRRDLKDHIKQSVEPRDEKPPNQDKKITLLGRIDTEVSVPLTFDGGNDYNGEFEIVTGIMTSVSVTIEPTDESKAILTFSKK